MFFEYKCFYLIYFHFITMKRQPVPTPTLLACKCEPGVGFSSPNHPPPLACKHEPGGGFAHHHHHHLTLPESHHVTTTPPRHHDTTTPLTSPCRPPRHHRSTTPTTATKNDEGPEKLLACVETTDTLQGSNRHLSVAVFLPCCQCTFNSRISSILVLILFLQIVTMTCL